jgi:hypothetical protein
MTRWPGASIALTVPLKPFEGFGLGDDPQDLDCGAGSGGNLVSSRCNVDENNRRVKSW